MKTLLCSNPPPVNLPKVTTPPESHPRTPNPIKPHAPKWKNKLQANAKGFATTSKEASRPPNNIKNKPGSDDDEPIPQEVFDRMIVRILVSVGVPLGTGVAILKILGHLKETNVWDVPMWVPFSTTIVTFGASALGIAYGSLSTSLDPDNKGSVLGFKEAQENWVDMWKEENGS